MIILFAFEKLAENYFYGREDYILTSIYIASFSERKIQKIQTKGSY
ncbi:MAG: hypothetical protein ACM3PX_04465 [Omnitrophica WOR_2 bacterium]|jgi:hypothetical protein